METSRIIVWQVCLRFIADLEHIAHAEYNATDEPEEVDGQSMRKLCPGSHENTPVAVYAYGLALMPSLYQFWGVSQYCSSIS